VSTRAVYSCGELGALLGLMGGGPFLDHDPRLQRFEGQHCFCAEENLSGWADHPEDPRKCWSLHSLRSDRYPGIELLLCCTCSDGWRAYFPGQLAAAALFDLVAEALGMALVPRQEEAA
jgi:hypothetical protein